MVAGAAHTMSLQDKILNINLQIVKSCQAAAAIATAAIIHIHTTNYDSNNKDVKEMIGRSDL